MDKAERELLDQWNRERVLGRLCLAGTHGQIKAILAACNFEPTDLDAAKSELRIIRESLAQIGKDIQTLMPHLTE